MSEEEKTPYLVVNENGDTFTFYVKGTKPYIDLQQRIDKAIEYIKKYGLYEELTDYDENDNLIITGVSDEKTTNDLLEILGDKEK